MTSRENFRVNPVILALERRRQTRFNTMPRVTITVPEKNAQPYRFQLDRQVVTLGRGSDNDIPIDSGSVSVKHAEMRRIGGGYELRDSGSTNGIKLADERYEIIPLRNGITVKLGDVAFDFMLTDEEQEALAHEKPDDQPAFQTEHEKSMPKLPPLKEMDESRPRPALSMPSNRDITGYAIVLSLILAVLAFWGGMWFRFHKETGLYLMDAIKAHRQTTKTPANITPTNAPDATTSDATAPDGAPPPATAPDGTTVPDATTSPATAPDTTVPATDPAMDPNAAPATTPTAEPQQ